MSALKKVFLRYRGEGHVRFDLPAFLCAPDKAALLAEKLRRLEGVYRVDISQRHRKLSIRHMPTVADFRSLIASLGTIVDSLAAPSHPGAITPVARSRRSGPWLQHMNEARPVRWIKEKVQEARETATAMRILLRRGINRSSPGHEPSDMLITFLNDVLALYLIKVHWSLMTRFWLRRPLEYRYQWLSAFYLLFLLVRSRQPKLR